MNATKLVASRKPDFYLSLGRLNESDHNQSKSKSPKILSP